MRSSELTSKLSLSLAQDIAAGVMTSGEHVSTQQVANRYNVSRTPVRDALISLEKAGVLTHQPNRGYFVSDMSAADISELVSSRTSAEVDHYQQLASDWLNDRLPESISEQALRQRYTLTKAKLTEVLARASREGWIEPQEGYGWRFLPVAKTAEAYEQIYRFRMTIEPAALLEPTFEPDMKKLRELRTIQQNMIEQDLDSLSAEHLASHGPDFHEELARMSNNPFFLTALQRANRMRRLLEYRITPSRERIVGQCTEHLEILDLIERGQTVEASYAMRKHLKGALSHKAPLTFD